MGPKKYQILWYWHLSQLNHNIERLKRWMYKTQYKEKRNEISYGVTFLYTLWCKAVFDSGGYSSLCLSLHPWYVGHYRVHKLFCKPGLKSNRNSFRCIENLYKQPLHRSPWAPRSLCPKTLGMVHISWTFWHVVVRIILDPQP